MFETRSINPPSSAQAGAINCAVPTAPPVPHLPAYIVCAAQAVDRNAAIINRLRQVATRTGVGSYLVEPARGEAYPYAAELEKRMAEGYGYVQALEEVTHKLAEQDDLLRGVTGVLENLI